MKENIQEISKKPRRSLARREASRGMKGNLESHGLVVWGIFIHTFYTVESTQLRILSLQEVSTTVVPKQRLHFFTALRIH